MPTILDSEPKLTFDDVLLVPQYSEVLSRSDVSTTTQLSRTLKLKIPIIAANMDTVCETEMAIALDNLGGMGILHRFNSIEQQVQMARDVMATSASANYGVAIGVGVDYKDRVRALYTAGARVFCVDIAHGDSFMAKSVTSWIRNQYPDVDIIAGNVVTPEGARMLAHAGANIIKIGVGPGAVCDTRQVAGTGYPQFSAILECASHGKAIIADGGIKTSGDIAKAIGAGANAVMLGSLLAGTDEAPGEIVLAATSRGREKFKIYRGMASAEALKARDGRTGETTDISDYAPEGVQGRVKYKGAVADVVGQLTSGLRSGMSYQGAHNISDFQRRAQFVKVSPTTQAENRPRV